MGDVGFDTEKKLWFVQVYNEINQSVGTYMAKTITLKGGRAAQYQWKDIQGRAFWHVRERFFAEEIENIGIDPSGVRLTITFKEDGGEAEDRAVPPEFSYLEYAFHLSNKELAIGNRAPMGFVEFFDTRGELVRRLNNRWIVIENIDRKSVGKYPKIRLRVEKKDVENIIATRTTIVIQGKSAQK